jgi:predicted RNA binding protein YcfA (HicA-like mRNA interferase family)
MNRIDLYARMRANPVGDWKMKDVEAVCLENGFACRPPTGGGSHFKVSHSDFHDILTIPARRPIKPVYIRKLVAMISQARRNMTA